MNKLLQWFKQFATSRDALMFLVFVMFSTMLWMSRADNGQRQHTLNVEVNYLGITPDIQLNDSLPHSIKITYTDNNKSLFYSKPKLRSINIDVSGKIEENDNLISISAGTIQQLVKDELPPSIAIQRIEPIGIQAAYTRLNSKVVPIKINGTLQPAPQYQLVGEISLEPSVVTIYGTPETIDSIESVPTIPINITNVKEQFSRDIELQPAQSIRLSQTQVRLIARTRAFTEMTAKLPIHIADRPNDISVKTFPAEVSVKMQMGIETYRTFKETDVRAFVNYNDMLKSDNGMVKVYVASESTHIYNIKVQPQNVEFIIEKK